MTDHRLDSQKPAARRTIAVFGGARMLPGSAEYEQAKRVGALLAQNGFIMVNGGYAGAMEASARGAREAGGRVIGVTSPLFVNSALNEFIEEEIPTDDLYTRIRELVMRGDGYVVLYGSIGTLAELHIVWNLATLEPNFDKPIILLGDYWRNVIDCYVHNLAVTGEHTRFLQFASNPEECVSLLVSALNARRRPAGEDPLPPAPSPPH